MLAFKSARVKTHTIMYAESEDTMEQLAQRIRTSGEFILGFDTEMVDTRISANKCFVKEDGSKFAPTVMIQLATSKEVAIFHFHEQLERVNKKTMECMRLPPTLQQLLRSDKFIKVGVATHNDTEGLYKTFGLPSVAQLVDLRALGACFSLPFNSLKDVANWCTEHKIDKETPHEWCHSLQKDTVGYAELEYAALDAIVCREAREKLARNLEQQYSTCPLQVIKEVAIVAI
jgi:ribonuclease D